MAYTVTVYVPGFALGKIKVLDVFEWPSLSEFDAGTDPYLI